MKALLPLLILVAAPAHAEPQWPPPGQAGAASPEATAAPAPADAAAPAPSAPKPHYQDPRLRDITYDPNTVVQLAVAPGHQMTLLFASGEKIQSVALGDSASWQVTASHAGDSLFVKPTGVSVGTNMTVISDTRTYLFDLVPAGPLDSVYLVRFSYPEPPPAAAGPQTSPAVRHGTYRVHGAPALRPDSIQDDGQRTYIVWGERKAMPAVFAIGPAGDEMLVDGYVRNGVYTVDRIYKTLIFRFDRKTATAVRR